MPRVKIEELREIYVAWKKKYDGNNLDIEVKEPYCIKYRASDENIEDKTQNENNAILKGKALKDKLKMLAISSAAIAKKSFSPTKVAIKAAFGKITCKEIQEWRDWQGMEKHGLSGHRFTLEGCICHENYDVMAIKEEDPEPKVSDIDIQREINFRCQEIEMNSRLTSETETSIDDEYTLMEL